MRAAPRAGRPGGRAHLRRQHRLRPLRLAVDPAGAGGGAPAAPAAQPRLRGRRAVSGRGRARGDAAARERAREGLLGRARRDGRAAVECLNRGVLPHVPARGSVGASGDLAPLAHLALPLVGEGQAWVDGERSAGRRGARRGWARADPPRGEGRALADQRDAVHGRDGRARARPRPAARAHRRPRVRALARGAAGLAHELPSGDPRGAAAARPARLGRERPPAARGLGDHRVPPLVRQGAGRLLAALRAAGARRQPRPARLRRGDGRGRAERRDRQPARPRRRRPRRLERQLPRPAARVRARRAGDGRRRAREHLRAARRAARQPVAVGWPAAVPDRRGRPQLRLHDPAVRGGVARVREQGRSATRRASTRSRRAPARRITSRWGTPPA